MSSWKVVRITSDGVNPSIYSVPDGAELVIERTGPDLEDIGSITLTGPYEGELPEEMDE